MNAKNEGLGWQRTIGLQVADVKRWTYFIVEVHEQCSKEELKDKVYFKLAIDSRLHWNHEGHVLQFKTLFYLNLILSKCF